MSQSKRVSSRVARAIFRMMDSRPACAWFGMSFPLYHPAERGAR